MNIKDDLVRSLSLSDYDNSRAVFEELCRKAGISPSGVGYFGNISFPGISDIDAIVIAKPNSIRILNQEFTRRRESDLIFRETFWHQPVYLIEPILKDARLLHTLDNVNFLEGNALSHISNPSPQNACLLHLVWLSSLLPIVKSILTDEVVSLRRLLLVNKNLSVTENYFNSLSGIGISPAIDNDELRQSVINTDVIDKEWVTSVFNQQFSNACEAVEKFLLIEDKNSTNGIGDRRVIVNRHAMLVASKRIRLEYEGKISSLYVPSAMIKIAEGFLGRRENPSTAIQQYVQASRRAKYEYKNAAIDYPFITPFGITQAIHKRTFLKLTSALLTLILPTQSF